MNMNSDILKYLLEGGDDTTVPTSSKTYVSICLEAHWKTGTYSKRWRMPRRRRWRGKIRYTVDHVEHHHKTMDWQKQEVQFVQANGGQVVNKNGLSWSMVDIPPVPGAPAETGWVAYTFNITNEKEELLARIPLNNPIVFSNNLGTTAILLGGDLLINAT